MQAAIIRAEAEPRPLSDFLIQRAYAALVLTRELALGHLVELEFEEPDANLMLDTVEAEYPSVFAPETIQSVRLPTVGALVEVLRLGMIDDLYFYARMAELGYERESADMYLALALRTESKSVKALSKAEIKQLYDMEIFDRGTSMIRMMGLGYNNEDAMYILRTVKSGIEFTDVWNNMMLQLITIESAVEHLFSMGFTDDEITLAFDTLTEEEQNVT
jgi:Holliday junction resolvasome RuvABC DNA-binding subunit